MKFVFLMIIPEQAVGAAIGLVTYQLSVKQFAKEGTIWFYDFHSDVELIKAFQRSE
jgi:hypothetical protein